METTDEQWLKLRDQLAVNAVHLLHQGSFAALTVSGRRLWVLRFRDREKGRIRQRALQVGPDRLKAKAAKREARGS